MFKLILRVLFYLIVISVFVFIGTVNNELSEIDGCKRQYIYTDLNDNKGTTNHCYKDEKGYVCRNKNRGFRVKELKEKRLCK